MFTLHLTSIDVCESKVFLHCSATIDCRVIKHFSSFFTLANLCLLFNPREWKYVSAQRFAKHRVDLTLVKIFPTTQALDKHLRVNYCTGCTHRVCLVSNFPLVLMGFIFFSSLAATCQRLEFLSKSPESASWSANRSRINRVCFSHCLLWSGFSRKSLKSLRATASCQ